MTGTAIHIRKHALPAQARLWLAALCVVLAMLPGFHYCRYGLGLVDESYQIINAIDWRNTPLAPLTAALSHLLTLLTTDVLAFRLLSLGLSYAGILAAGLFAWRMTRRLLASTALTCAALWCTSFSHIQGWLYGWDTFAFFSLTLTLVATLAYVARPGLRALLAVALATAFSVLCRLPDVACMPAVGAAILIASPKRAGGRAADLALYAGATAALCLLCLTLLYGSPEDYAEALRRNMITGHTTAEIISGYKETVAWSLPSALLWGGLYAVALAATGTRVPAWAKAGAGLLCVAVSALVLRHFRITPTETLYLYMATFVSWSTLCILLCRRTPRRWAIFIAVLGVALSLCAGTNTGFIKMLTYALLPLIGIYLYGRVRTAYLLLTTLCVAAFTVAQIRYRPVYVFEDAGMALATAQISSGPQRGLRTSPQKAAMIAAIQRDLRPYAEAGYKIKVLGRNFEKFGWELQYGDINPALRHVWTSIDSTVPGYKEYIRSVARRPGKTAALWLAELGRGDYLLHVPSSTRDEWETDTLEVYMERRPVSGPGYRIYVSRR